MADENTSNTSNDESSDSGLGAFSGFHTQEQSEVRNNGDLPHRSRDQQEIEDRNKLYTQILSDYKEYISQNLLQIKISKEQVIKIFKTILYSVIFGSFLTVIIAIFFAPNLIASISAIIVALVSFISSMIIIPTKITEYLFNVNETTQFGDIIKNFQNVIVKHS